MAEAGELRSYHAAILLAAVWVQGSLAMSVGRRPAKALVVWLMMACTFSDGCTCWAPPRISLTAARKGGAPGVCGL